MKLTFNNSVNSEDLGLMFGLSLFETFYVNKNGSVFLLEEHIKRLYSSMCYFRFSAKFTYDDLLESLQEYIKINCSNEIVRLTVTFGNGNKNIDPSLIITKRRAYEFKNKPLEYRLTMSNIKHDPASPILSHKTANYIEKYHVALTSQQNNFDDALFSNIYGKITETTKCNIFFVSNGIIHTPHVDCGLLRGITRDWIIKKSCDMKLPIETGFYCLDDMLKSNEVFLTNSAVGIISVKSIDNTIFNASSDSSITQLLFDEYKTQSIS